MSMSALLREKGTLAMCLLVAQASTKSREEERLEMCRYCISASPHTEQDLHCRSLPRDLCRTIPMLLLGTYVSQRCTVA
jgi:hypothetical protein